MERAHTLDERMRGIATRNTTGEVEAAISLDVLDSTHLYGELTHTSITAYAHEVFHYSAEKTRILLKIVRESPAAIYAAFEAGTLPWSKAGELLKIATDDNVEFWLDRAAELGVTELRREVAEALGKEQKLVLTRRVTADEKAAIETLELFMRHQGFETRGAALAEAARRILSATGAGTQAPALVTVYDYCSSCAQTTREGPTGPVPVMPAALEQALRHADVADLRGAEAKILRPIPPRVVKGIETRNKVRCQVPHCRLRVSVQLHHQGALKSAGRDPDQIVSLCKGHRDQRHTGKLKVEIDRDVVRFRRSDGKLVGQVRTAESPSDASGVEPATQSASPSPLPSSSSSTAA